MASNNVACIGQRSACALRVTRLNADCSPATGSNNAFVTAALVTMTVTPDIEAGTRFEPKNACGDIMWTAVDPDILKRYTFDLELGSFDFEGIELMTDATLILGATGTTWPTKAIGVAMPGSDTTHGNGVALEIWTKTATGTGVCGAVSNLPPYVHHLFPRVKMAPGARTFANDIANATFSGTSEANATWGSGPWSDWQGPTTGIPDDSPYVQWYDTTLPTTGCGYIDVP